MLGDYNRRDRTLAGLTRALERGTRLGRPTIDPAKAQAIKAARTTGKSYRAIAREFGVGHATVARLTIQRTKIIKREPIQLSLKPLRF